VGDDFLRVSATCRVPLDELDWRVSRSGGPGGQHANTSETRVEVVFDVTASRALGPRQRARLVERLGPVVRAVAADSRSQARNRELALERLRTKLGEGLRVERPRRATRPSRAARAARVDSKRRRSTIKRHRRPPNPDD
jgi:ribosome-associated protein